MTCVEAFAGHGGRGQAAVGVLRGVRLRGRRGPRARARRPARGRHPVSARRQARRHRLDDGRVRRGLPRHGQRRSAPTPSRSAPTSASSRCARPSTWPRSTGRGRLRPRPHLQPRGRRRCSTPIRDGRTVAAGIVDGGAAADNAAAAARGELGSVGLVVGATVGDAVAGPGPRPRRGQRARCSRPGVGAQGAHRGRPAHGVRRRPWPTSWPAAAARCSRRGPDGAALRAARAAYERRQLAVVLAPERHPSLRRLRAGLARFGATTGHPLA